MGLPDFEFDKLIDLTTNIKKYVAESSNSAKGIIIKSEIRIRKFNLRMSCS